MELLGWVTAILLALYIKAAPIDECSRCLHCRQERLDKENKQKQINDEYAHKERLVLPEECKCEICMERIRRRNG